jgi:ABC-type ATPase involved in cell division
MEIFRDLHRKGTTIVLATQDTGLIRHYPNRVIPLLDGKKEESDAV